MATIASQTFVYGKGVEVRVKLPTKILAENSLESVSGRLYVFFHRLKNREPRFAPNLFNPKPFCAIDVKDLVGETAVTLDDAADSFPKKLSQFSSGVFYAQAVLAHRFESSVPGTCPGNFYSEPIEFTVIEGGESAKINLELTKTVARRKFIEQPNQKFERHRSSLLSEFHGQDVYHEAAVILPPAYLADPKRKFPVIYIFGGYGASVHSMALRYREWGLHQKETNCQFVRVLLSGDCSWGCHYFVNSPTNGPRRDAFMKELIPNLESNYRIIADSRARFLYGHGGGGWSALWLQTNHPEAFGGSWSFAPDSVDFRKFFEINLYAQNPGNLFLISADEKRPFLRQQRELIQLIQDLSKAEDVLERGGQLRSYEAAFSPLNDDGLPQKLWDRKTGLIQSEVANSWKKFDISLKLKQNWDDLKDPLAGKIHVMAAESDSYFFDGATRLLKERMKDLNSDAKIWIELGDHHSVVNAGAIANQRGQMIRMYSKHFDLDGNAKD